MHRTTHNYCSLLCKLPHSSLFLLLSARLYSSLQLSTSPVLLACGESTTVLLNAIGVFFSVISPLYCEQWDFYGVACTDREICGIAEACTAGSRVPYFQLKSFSDFCHEFYDFSTSCLQHSFVVSFRFTSLGTSRLGRQLRFWLAKLW